MYVVKINFHQEIQTKYSLTHKIVNIPTVVKTAKTEWEKYSALGPKSLKLDLFLLFTYLYRQKTNCK